MKLTTLIILILSPLLSVSQIQLPTIEGEEDWEKVIITKNPNEVQGLTPMDEIEVQSMKLFGKQSKLRIQAKEQLKRECAKLKIPIIFVTSDIFLQSPINNVTLIGTPYKNTGSD